MCLSFKYILCLVNLLALLQVIQPRLINPDEDVDGKLEPVQYGCVNNNMAVELLTKVKLIETRTENMLYKLNSNTPTAINQELSHKDHEKINQNIKDTIKALLDSQEKTSNSEFSRANYRLILQTINESLKNIKGTQSALHNQTKILEAKFGNNEKSKNDFTSFLEAIEAENNKLTASLQNVLTKIMEQKNLQFSGVINNQIDELQVQIAELNNNLRNNSINIFKTNFQEIIQAEMLAFRNSLKENSKEIFKAELNEIKKILSTQPCPDFNSGFTTTAMQTFIMQTMQKALNDQEKFLLENLQKQSKTNLKYSEKYLSTATGICNAMNGLPENCEEALRGNPQCGEGVYLLYVPGYDLDPFFAYCLPDYTTPSMPSWTIIQKRESSLYNFNRGWSDYTDGFGDVKSSFWLGLKYIHALTSHQSYELWAEMEDWEGAKRFAIYDKFVVGSEKNKFPLSILGKYGGNAGDSLTYHIGQKFTTNDADNDERKTGNCATDYAGGWWFGDCHVSNPNGIYNSTEYAKGINWKSWHGYKYSFKYFHLAIRPNKL